MDVQKLITCHENVLSLDEDVVREISVKVRGVEIASFSAWVEGKDEVLDWKIKPGQISASFLLPEFKGDKNELLTYISLEMRQFFAEINAFFIKGKFFYVE